MFSIGFLTLDILIVLIVAIAFFFLSIFKGEHIPARILLSFYPATLVFAHFPYISFDGALTKVAVYAILLIAFYFLLARNLTIERSYKGTKKVFDAVILSLATVVMFLTLYYHTLPISEVYSFTLPVESLFISALPYGVWLLVPIIALVIVNRGAK